MSPNRRGPSFFAFSIISKSKLFQSGRSCDELHPSCNHISLKESYDNSVKKVFAVTETSPTKTNTPRKEEEQPAEEDEEYEYYYDRK